MKPIFAPTEFSKTCLELFGNAAAAQLRLAPEMTRASRDLSLLPFKVTGVFLDAPIGQPKPKVKAKAKAPAKTAPKAAAKAAETAPVAAKLRPN